MVVPETEVLVRAADGTELLRTVLTPGDYVLGRSPDCELAFAADLVSRRHAQLTLEYDQAFIQDLGSSNGTFVNDAPVTEITRLWPGQKIRVGSASVELRRVKTATPPDASLAPQAAAMQRLLPEELLREKKYDIGAVVAQGGMGAILAARDAATQRGVAMKVMLNGSSPDDLARFVAEARVTAQLEHPNIVPVHELSVDENGQPFYTMKMVRGVTLKKVLGDLAAGIEPTVKKYPLLALLTVFQKVCDALAFAHSRGVIHRDLKPENIMLGDFGEVLVMDWGLAKRMRNAEVGTRNDVAAPAADHSAIPIPHSEFTSATLAGTIMGTPAYMSPEQARGEVEDLDARSDIYSLGAILYSLLVLRPSVTGRSVGEIVDKVGRGEIEPLECGDSSPLSDGRRSRVEARAPRAGKAPMNRRTPQSLAAVVRKAMAFEREQRYPHVEALQADLTAYQTGFATSAENAGMAKHLALLLKRHKGIATAIAASLVVLAAVVGVAFIRITGEKNRAEAALSDLLKTAPTLIAEGRKLIDAQQFDDALAKISFAVSIEPRNPSHRLLRAQLLQAMLRLDEAAAEFRRVLALGPNDSAQANLALCEKVLREYKSADAFDQAAYQQIYEHMEKEGRFTQAVPITQKLGLSRKASEALLNTRLVEWRKIPGWEKNPEKDRVKWEPDGTLSLDFRSAKIPDIPMLRGLPVSGLILDDVPIGDLRPLEGMRLRKFSGSKLPNLVDLSPLSDMPIELCWLTGNVQLSDLSALRGMKLKEVWISGADIRDITPLAGMPLKSANIVSTSIKDLNALAGAPITDLTVYTNPELVDISAVRTMKQLKNAAVNSPLVKDVAPLLDCPALETVALPIDVKEIEVLRSHPRLRSLGYDTGRMKPAAAFWAEFDAIWKARDEDAAMLAKLRTAFAAAGLPEPDEKIVHRQDDGSYSIRFTALQDKVLKRIPNLRGLPISDIGLKTCKFTDLSPLAGLPLRKLDVSHTTPNPMPSLEPLRRCPQLEELDLSNSTCSDLAALAGLKLHVLNIENTPVADISALAGMPLRSLQMYHAQVADISVLAGMPLLELRCEQTKVTDLRPLLSCPDLEILIIPEKAANIGELRALKKLKRLSTRWENALYGPAQSAEEFWKEYDAQQAAGKK